MRALAIDNDCRAKVKAVDHLQIGMIALPILHRAHRRLGNHMEIAILINNQHIHGFVRAVIIENTLAHQVSLGIKIAEIAVHRQHRIVSLRDERRLIRAAGIDLIGQRRAQLLGWAILTRA